MQNRKSSYLAKREHQLASRFQRGLLVLTITLLALLGTAFYHTPQAHAGTTLPVIHWDGTMIYPGQNNGFPEGPVGEIAVVHGENFTALAGQPLKLTLVAGNSNNDSTLCQPANTLATIGNATPSASGTFSANFSWPSEAGQVSKGYSICALVASTNTVASSLDDGPFTVLAASKPTLKISAGSVAAGGSITVSGKNWVPPQPLNINIAGCADCDPGNSTLATTTTSSAGLNSGTFSITVPIPATAAPGNYVVNVFSQTGPLDAFHLAGVGVQQLVVTAPPVAATPSVTPSVTASATVSTTPTVTASPTSNPANNNSSSGSNTGLLIGVLITIVVLLLAIAGIIFYMLKQRNKQSSPPASPSGYSGAGQFNQYSGSGGPITPFPSSPGQYDSSPNPGYQNQPWQGNQQGQTFAPRNCLRCGSPLAPNSAICGRCGLHNSSTSDPNGPTIAN